MGIIKKIYISGKITGVTNFKEKFAAVAEVLLREGYEVFNPANQPPGLQYEEYMRRDFDMIRMCDSIYMMPCWPDSPGAIRERQFAKEQGKRILHAG